MYKIIGADQKEYGPITADQLRLWISEGRINGNTKIQVEGVGIWKTVSEFPEFAAALPVAAPPAPPALFPPIAPMAMPPAALKSNQLAMWAMVTGIISVVCCQILGPVCIVLGIVALSQIKKNPGQQGSGFAITGIILGVVSLIVAVICIVMFVTSPQMFQNFGGFPH